MTESSKLKYVLWITALTIALSACSSAPTKKTPTTAAINSNLQNADFNALNYDYRTWYPAQDIPFNTIELSKSLQAPINAAEVKTLGPEYNESIQSLAAKIWLIDNAKYTVDMAYYIFKRDRVGYAILGALCNAVQRGVDVRLTVDSGGSIHHTHNELKALQTCSEQGGNMLNAAGQATSHKARAQVVIVNAISKVFVHMNRRSHDKLLVVDGMSRADSVVMTGGRNISVDYYGITEDGKSDPSAYQDMEIMLRPRTGGESDSVTVGQAATFYYTLLFLNEGNKYLHSAGSSTASRNRKYREKAQDDLAFLKQIPSVHQAYARMPMFVNANYRSALVRLGHELDNLTNSHVIDENIDNKVNNSNSISDIFREELIKTHPENMRIVSPYFFFAKYKGKNGKPGFDGAAAVLKILHENSNAEFEMVTNSALTSDNFMAQSVIDMDTAPRMLLSPEMAKKWRSGLRRGQVDRNLVESEEWKRQVNNSRIRIYETGRLDAAEFGGPTTYGKLHAKFMVFDNTGFVGSDNFDYRSRLFNNEFGFFYQSQPLSVDLNIEFDKLIAKSYLWGSPEWLDARDKLMAQKGMKARTTRLQRFLYKFSRSTGLIWWF